MEKALSEIASAHSQQVTSLIRTESVLSSKIHIQMASNTTKSHLEQFNGTASHGEDIKGEISGANFIPVIKAAILKSYSYKLQASYKFMQLTLRQEI